MDILAALKQEEAKFERQAEGSATVGDCVCAAMKLFRGETAGKRTGEEKGNVCGWESKDFEGNKSAVGKV